MIMITEKQLEKLQKICSIEIHNTYINRSKSLSIECLTGYYEGRHLKHILECNPVILYLLSSSDKNKIQLGLNLL
jgi:hypothetical protein